MLGPRYLEIKSNQSPGKGNLTFKTKLPLYAAKKTLSLIYYRR